MSRKIFVCRCEDVTLAEVEAAFAGGYDTIEAVKRYTGLGTGPCQGRECMVPAALALSRLGARQPEPFTSRPPVHPTPLAAFAARETSAEGDGER